MGHVVDFLYIPWLLPAIFNIADVFIVSSMGLLLLLTLLGVGLDGTRASKKTATTETRPRPTTPSGTVASSCGPRHAADGASDEA